MDEQAKIMVDEAYQRTLELMEQKKEEVSEKEPFTGLPVPLSRF